MAETSVLLGVDTGGTYTDAVLWSEADGLMAKAKAITTHSDLIKGIKQATACVLSLSALNPDRIKLVSLSTTLATNALVEGRKPPVALVMIGFSEHDLTRNRLKQALGGDKVIFCPGGHDAFGNQNEPLNLEPLLKHLPRLASTVVGFAVCSCFAVRNPEHEIAACDVIRHQTGLPVTASYELSSRLGGPKRALTTLFNARLITIIDQLLAAAKSFLAQTGITAPLMVVRGDGSLVASEFAEKRPIETILSGPAASIVGGRYLSGCSDAIVSDLGGTTTDIAILSDGRPRLDPDGAVIGQFRTMVEAVAMRTFGLGGDSEVSFNLEDTNHAIVFGPKRIIPVALAAISYGQTLISKLERQLTTPGLNRYPAQFVVKSSPDDRLSTQLQLGRSEAALYDELSFEPVAVNDILTSQTRKAVLDRLIDRGLVMMIGFTPSDAAHVVGKQDNWHKQAAVMAGDLVARINIKPNQPLAASGQALAQYVLTEFSKRSATVLLATTLKADGIDADSEAGRGFIARAINEVDGLVNVSFSLDRPVIGLGASAALHYADLPSLLNNRCLIPDDADVANALGAIVGQVRVKVESHVSKLEEGHFRVVSEGGIDDFPSEQQAIDAAVANSEKLAVSKSDQAGIANADIAVDKNIRTATVEGRRLFVEADITVTATGRPKIAD